MGSIRSYESSISVATHDSEPHLARYLYETVRTLAGLLVALPRRRLNDLTGKEWVRATKSWFVINPKPRTRVQVRHPAKYPEELVMHFLRFFTREDDWVLDPFAGVGSTLVACKEMQRNCVGIELNPEFVNIGEQHLTGVEGNSDAHLITGDAMAISALMKDYFGSNVPQFDFVMTSPPYWNMLRKSRGGNDSVHKQRRSNGLALYYSDMREDIGNIEEYESYIESMGRVFDGIRRHLNDRAYLVIVAQNMRDTDGEMKPIAWDLARRLSMTYTLRQEMIWCQDNKQLGCWGYPTTYVSNVHHHYCLVFQKKYP